MRNRNFARSLLTISFWTAASCGVTLAIFNPADLQAVSGDSITASARVADPHLDVNGVELRVRRDDPAAIVHAGDALALTIDAVNHSDKSITISPQVAMRSIDAPAVRASRVAPLPTEIWKQQPTITLAPGESRSIGLEKSAPLPASSEIDVTISADHSSAWVLRVSTKAS